MDVNRIFTSTNKISIANDPDRYYKDYSELSDDILIKYGVDWDMVCTKEEFLKYQKEVLKFKQILMNKNLSPVEKLLIAYDFVKKKPYNLSDDESLNGLPHHVLFGDYVACRGYCNLLMELLAGEGIKIVDQQLDVYDKNGVLMNEHARCTVLLDDAKYNIHGLFVVSPTEDCYNEQNKAYLGNDLQPTDLYSWFLRPLRDSELYHSDDCEFRITYMDSDDKISADSRSCYDDPEYKLNYLLENNDLEELELLNELAFCNLFKDLSKDEILEYTNTGYIDFSVMLEIIKNVKLALGSSLESVVCDMERISRINSEFFPTESNVKHRF